MAYAARKAHCNAGATPGSLWSQPRHLERALVPRSADLRAAGNRGGLLSRSFTSSKSQQARNTGRKELLVAGSIHHANGHDHRRRLCCRFDADRLSSHPRARWNSQDAAPSRRHGRVVLHAYVADLLGAEPDFQRTLRPRVGSSGQGHGLSRRRRRRISRPGSSLGDGPLIFRRHADGHQIRHARDAV